MWGMQLSETPTGQDLMRRRPPHSCRNAPARGEVGRGGVCSHHVSVPSPARFHPCLVAPGLPGRHRKAACSPLPKRGTHRHWTLHVLLSPPCLREGHGLGRDTAHNRADRPASHP